MHALCKCDDISDGKARAFNINGVSVFAVRQGDAYHTYVNRCPHLGIPLEWSPDDFIDRESDLIRCSTHGALFIVETGACVSGPCLGDKLSLVKTHIESGTIYVDL